MSPTPSIAALRLSSRSAVVLDACGVATVAQLRSLLQRFPRLRGIPGAGRAVRCEVLAALVLYDMRRDPVLIETDAVTHHG